MEGEIATLAQIFTALSDQTGEGLQEAQEAIYQYENSPIDFINLLVAFIQTIDNERLQSYAAVYLNRVMNRLSATNQIAKFPDDFADHLKGSLLQFIQTNSSTTCMNNFLYAINTLVTFYRGSWEGLLETMFSLCQTEKAHYAINVIAFYIEGCTIDDFDESAIAAFTEIFNKQYTDEKAQAEQFYLYLSMAHLSIELLVANLERASTILMGLSSSLGTQVAKIVDYFENLDTEMKEAILPLFVTVLRCFETTNEGSKISVIESFANALEFPEVQALVLEQMELFLSEVMAIISTDAQKGSDQYSVNALFGLFENAFENQAIKELFIQNTQELYQTDNPYILAALARIYSPVEIMPTLISLLNEELDPTIYENILNALNELIINRFAEVTELNDEIMAQIFEAVGQKIDIDFPYYKLAAKVVGSLCESALENDHKSFVLAEAENILGLISNVLIPETMLIAASLVTADENNELAELSESVSNALIESLQNEDESEFENALELFQYESNFLKKLSDEYKTEFIAKIAEIIEATSGSERSVSIVTQLGLGYCIKTIGKEIFQPYFTIITAPILERLLNGASYGYDSVMDGTQSNEKYSHFFVAGSNQRILIHNEEVDELIKALMNMSIIIDVIGADVTQIEGFLENINKVISVSIKNPLDEKLRQNAYTLLGSVIMAIPETQESYHQVISRILLPSDDQRSMEDIVYEPENRVLTTDLKRTSEIICHDDKPPQSEYQQKIQPFITFFAQLLPAFVHLRFVELARDNEAKINSNVYQEYFDCLWETMVLMKNIEEHELSNEKEVSIAAYTAIMEILGGISLTYDVVETMKAGLTADFLEQIPHYAGFSDAFLVIQEEIQQTENADARSTALYGFGRVLAKQDALSADQLDQMIDFLFGVLSGEDMEEEQFQNGRENGVSSFAILLKKRMTMGGGVEHLEQFLQLLPVYIDADESTIVYSFMVDCLNMSLPQEIKDAIFQVLAVCLQDEDAKETVTAIVSKLLDRIPSQYRAQLVSE